MLGYMAVPDNFRYADVLQHGRPIHAINDSFAIKHPAMPLGKRAKIFSPFDALKGFSEAVEAKDKLYCERIELSEDECAGLDSKIAGLLELVHDGSSARENNVVIRVTHFVPCTDKDNNAFGRRGQYVETKGVLTCIDTVKRTLTAGGEKILFGDILNIVKE
jgi:hypothetical protein